MARRTLLYAKLDEHGLGARVATSTRDYAEILGGTLEIDLRLVDTAA